MPDLKHVFVFDWPHIGFLLVFGLLSGTVNLIVTKKSQIDAWAESQPRLAGAFKVMRGFGIDPWVIVQGFCLLFLGRLPDYVKQDAEAIQAMARPKPSRPPILPIIMCGWLLGLLVLLCGACWQSVPPKPCPLALEADYTAAIAKACADAGSAENCPSFPALRAEHEAEQLDAGCRVGN